VINEAGYIGGAGRVWIPSGVGTYSTISLSGDVRDLSEPRLESGRVTFDAITVNGTLYRLRLP
jgi:hypothetical protein